MILVWWTFDLHQIVAKDSIYVKLCIKYIEKRNDVVDKEDINGPMKKFGSHVNPQLMIDAEKLSARNTTKRLRC